MSNIINAVISIWYIQQLNNEWIRNKDCLDIGCNSGAVSLEIAIAYNANSVLGIDIDKDLIHRAKVSCRKKQIELNDRIDLNGIVSFRCVDYNFFTSPYKYDVIFCLSVSKWIHLNQGDMGIFKLFMNVYNQLHTNGMFIFEPQPWTSYKKAKFKGKSDLILKMKIQPECFPTLLITCGFEMVAIKTPQNANEGFKSREVYIFKKATAGEITIEKIQSLLVAIQTTTVQPTTVQPTTVQSTTTKDNIEV